MTETHECGYCRKTLVIIEHGEKQRHIYFQQQWFCDAQCTDKWLREHVQQEAGQ